MLLDPRGAKGLPPKKPLRAPVKRRPGTEANAFAKSPAQPTTTELQASLDALRPPLIHLLALGSDSEGNIAMKTHAPVDLCLRILQKIGNRTKAGNHWELDDYVYRDLDLWKFPYGSQKDRETAIKNTEAAFRRLRLSSDAPEWDLLVAPEERGKVKHGPPPPPTLPKPRSLPKLNVSKVDGEGVPPAEVSPTASEKSIGADRGTRSVSSQPPSKTRRVGEKDTIARIIANKGKPQKAKKEAVQKEKKEKATPGNGPKKGRPPKPKGEAPPKPTKRPTKWKHPEGGIAAQSQTRETQYKSAEFVESDSDPEEGVKATATSPMPAGTQARATGRSPLPSTSHGQARIDPPKTNPRTTSSTKKRTADTPKLPKSTTSPVPKKVNVSAKTLASRVTESVVEKAQKERQSSKPAGAAGDTRAFVDLKAKDGRASEKEQLGHTASPLKRSSTNSSPTVVGQETGSVASTPKTLTSTGTVSTPTRCSPSHHTTVAAQPVTKGKSRLTQETSSVPLKRKADRIGDLSASQPNKRAKIPDEKTILMAKRFKEDYAKYAKLYKEAQQKTSDRPLMDKVIKMHKTLQDMKLQLVKLAAA